MIHIKKMNTLYLVLFSSCKAALCANKSEANLVRVNTSSEVLAAKFGDYCDEKQYVENSPFNQNHINMLQCEYSTV